MASPKQDQEKVRDQEQDQKCEHLDINANANPTGQTATAVLRPRLSGASDSGYQTATAISTGTETGTGTAAVEKAARPPVRVVRVSGPWVGGRPRRFHRNTSTSEDGLARDVEDENESVQQHGVPDEATIPQKRRNYLRVNGVAYTLLDRVGRGGSCCVYKVMDEYNSVFALKRVDIKDVEESTL